MTTVCTSAVWEASFRNCRHTLAKQWNYYAVIALAQLPDGAGVPSLIRMAQEENGYGPLQMLAQLASDNPDARTALLD